MYQEGKGGQRSSPTEGRYVKYFKIGHNAFEFIIDCGQCYADNEEPQLHTRIVTSPAYGTALLNSLRDSLEQHEKAYRRIETDSSSDVLQQGETYINALNETSHYS